MIIFIGLLLILALYKINPKFNKSFYTDYASIEQTRSINGICIMLILLSHTFARISPNGVLDEIYEPMRIFLGQFVVVPFLFYSGYGVMESIKRKNDYIKTFPRKRFLRIVIEFAIITVVYIILNLCLGNKYSIPHVLLSFTGVTTIGNGNWYILSTFVFYISIILCFNLFRKSKILATIGVTACLVALMVVEMILDFPSYYYSTTIFFAVGMFFSFIKETFDKIVMKNNIVYFIFLVLAILGFAFLKKLVDKTVIFYPVWCGFGMLSILLITMKIKVANKPLIWLGKTTFFNFTLQGISQIIFTKYLTNNYLIYCLVIIVTLILTCCAYNLSNYFERKIKGN
ncbi:MAG: acyltransferase family protein [Clostridia bacterium]|nr:acyltransferase family protein [Clostridia bacterium]